MSSSTVPPATQPGQPQQQQAQGAQQQQQGLPPTGLQQQLASLNSFYQQVGQAGGGMGFNVQQQQFGQAQAAGGGELPPDTGFGSSSLDQMARNLAQRYGMPIGQGRLVDQYGNFMMNPQQMADASGGTMTTGTAAAQMNYIAQALARKQNEDQQQKGIATMQAGLGLVQSRGRGSMAGMMSGYYEGIADLYANQEYEAYDFSYYIQKEQMDIANEMQRRQERAQKKAGRGQMFAGIGLTVAGILSGNVGLIGMGAGNTVGGAATSGWF